MAAFISPANFAGLAKGTALTVTLNKGNLVGDTAFIAAADAYFLDTTNWKSVLITMKSTSGQSETMIFDCDNVLATVDADFLISSTARDVWEIHHVIVKDFDNGYVRLSAKAGQLIEGDFNFDLTPAPLGYFNTFDSALVAGFESTINGDGAAATKNVGSISYDAFSGAAEGTAVKYIIDLDDPSSTLSLSSSDTINASITINNIVASPSGGSGDIYFSISAFDSAQEQEVGTPSALAVSDTTTQTANLSLSTITNGVRYLHIVMLESPAGTTTTQATFDLLDVQIDIV